METELYLPLKEYLIAQGFSVRGEVHGCDLAALKDDELVLVELKKAINLELILQGNERKRLSDNVYLAVPQPKRANSRWQKIIRLCRALGLGLLVVSPGGCVQLVCQPSALRPRQSYRAKERLLTEFRARSGDYNLGGSQGRPLVTAYREQALQIAEYIGEERRRLQEITAATGIAKAPSILQKNYYGWFTRVARGIYALSPQGRQALKEYAAVLGKQ